MKYIRTAIAEQETTINVLYDEQIIRIYSSRVEIIKILTKQLGEPTKKYKKSKTYWTGANWDISFNDLKKIEKILLVKNFIDSEIDIIPPKKEKLVSKKRKTTENKKANITLKAKPKTKLETKKESVTPKAKTKSETKKELVTPKPKIKLKTEKVAKKENAKELEEYEQFSLI